MSYVPASLAALNALWKGHGGTLLGVVGSMTTHCGGYHLGKDRIFGACACKPGGICEPGAGANDFSVQTARDKAGLTNAAMAIDLGPTTSDPLAHNNLAIWLIAQCRAGAPDTADIRAINYELLRWDRQRGQTSATYTHSVNEHGHCHIEWYRDSEARDKTAAVARYFASLTTGGASAGSTLEDQMSYPVPKAPSQGYIPAGKKAFHDVSLTGTYEVVLPGRNMPYLGAPTSDARIVAWTDAAGVPQGVSMYVAKADLTNIAVIGSPTACTQAELDAAVLQGRQYEWDRQFTGTAGAKVTPLAKP